jgi:hypothetical protein
VARAAAAKQLSPGAMRCRRKYGFGFHYKSRPQWPVYANYLELAASVRRDLSDLRPRDMIDIQSFLWIQGSDEY